MFCQMLRENKIMIILVTQRLKMVVAVEEDLEILISLVASQTFLKIFLEKVSVAAEDLDGQTIEVQILDMIYLSL